MPPNRSKRNFFTAARLDIWFGREGKVVAEANEWFDVPLGMIDQAIELINAETIGSYEYDRGDRTIQIKRTHDATRMRR